MGGHPCFYNAPVRVPFSRRVPADLAPNRLAALRAAGHTPEIDLTASNPTACGLEVPSALLAPLADPAGLEYRPDPRGLRRAREAVAAEYARFGAAVDPDRIILTASTSEAYAFLFKLLCEPRDAVLVPAPSYPLFEHLARLEAVDAPPYHLGREAGWRLDLDELAGADGRVRAVVVVHPNNPTGSFVHPDDAADLAALAARRGWAVIADEVFLDYPLDGGPGSGRSFAAEAAALTFVLGGLSKSVALPQLKLGWIVVGGPTDLVAAARERLELVADTFLSVATPVQLAAPALLRDGAASRAAVLARCRVNLATLRAAAAGVGEVDVLPVGGGWSAVLRIPSVVGEEDLAVELLVQDRVAVHPGYFFDFPADGYLVVSLLPEPGAFAAGIDRVLRRLAAHLVTP